MDGAELRGGGRGGLRHHHMVLQMFGSPMCKAHAALLPAGAHGGSTPRAICFPPRPSLGNGGSRMGPPAAGARGFSLFRLYSFGWGGCSWNFCPVFLATGDQGLRSSMGCSGLGLSGGGYLCFLPLGKGGRMRMVPRDGASGCWLHVQCTWVQAGYQGVSDVLGIIITGPGVSQQHMGCSQLPFRAMGHPHHTQTTHPMAGETPRL